MVALAAKCIRDMGHSRSHAEKRQHSIRDRKIAKQKNLFAVFYAHWIPCVAGKRMSRSRAELFRLHEGGVCPVDAHGFAAVIVRATPVSMRKRSSTPLLPPRHVPPPCQCHTVCGGRRSSSNASMLDSEWSGARKNAELRQLSCRFVPFRCCWVIPWQVVGVFVRFRAPTDDRVNYTWYKVRNVSTTSPPGPTP
jgi:hypothetical protein